MQVKILSGAYGCIIDGHHRVIKQGGLVDVTETEAKRLAEIGAAEPVDISVEYEAEEKVEIAEQKKTEAPKSKTAKKPAKKKTGV